MNSEVKSAGRILDLIAYLAERREPVALTQIVADLGIPKSSAHGLVQTLAARGHVVQDGNGRYVLVEQARHGFPFHRNEEPLVAIAMPLMTRLRNQSGETVLLASMNANCEVRRLAKCVSLHPVRYDVHMDAAITPHCTASGRVLLAFAPKETQENYLSRVQFLSYTRYTVTEPAEIRALLARVRKTGHAINDQEFITGSTGIAAPVRNHRGAVVAALNLGTLSSRYAERKRHFVFVLREAARDLSAALGYRAPGSGY